MEDRAEHLHNLFAEEMKLIFKDTLEFVKVPYFNAQEEVEQTQKKLELQQQQQEQHRIKREQIQRIQATGIEMANMNKIIPVLSADEINQICTQEIINTIEEEDDDQKTY